MKKLVMISMVQYFLYERTDLEIGHNTAFLGPNGTGKTALLDAFQIVILAADGNRTHYNASGEGKRRARTLRDYCLGVYGQTDDKRYRNAANTYINLVFRDQKTNYPVTIGASFSADETSPEATLNGLYVLPGVALTSKMHVEVQDGKEVTIPWRRFQHIIADECRAVGTTAEITKNRQTFLRHVFVGNLASPGERPNTKSIQTSFARSLKLNQDVADLNEVLRDNLVEEHITDVALFKARLLQFRDLRELVRVVQERIERVSGIAAKYSLVLRERTAATNVQALEAVYETERVAENLSATQDKVDELTGELSAKQDALKEAELAVELHEAARDRALQARDRDPDYAKQASTAAHLSDLERSHGEKASELSAMVAAATSAVAQAGRLPDLGDAQEVFEAALAQLLALPVNDEHAPLPAEQLRSVATALEKTSHCARRAATTAEQAAKSALDARREAKSTLERAQQGLRKLREPVSDLRRLLHEHGITATPVADLVSIKDPTWQPALEAFLTSHADALLVAGGREQELRAIDVYRKHGPRLGLWRVKLAMPSRGRPWQSRSAGRFAADLIEGDVEAVRYLQGVLGQLTLASSNEELLDSARTISKEGMVSTGGSIELRERPKQLIIGRVDSAQLQEEASRELAEAERVYGLAQANATALGAAANRLGLYASADETFGHLNRLFSSVRGSLSVVEQMRERLAAVRSGELDKLEGALAVASERRDLARRQVIALSSEVGGLTQKLNQATQAVCGLEGLLESAQANEKLLRAAPLYDANEVERHRARYDARLGEDVDAKQAACRTRVTQSNGAASEADHEGWSSFCQYAADFALQNHDLTKQQWQQVHAFAVDEKQRLEGLELVQRKEEAEQAYQAAVDVFRTDVAQNLLEGFDAVSSQIDGLNDILRSAPEFSNGERYQFVHSPVEQHRALYNFLLQVKKHGEEGVDLFKETEKVPEEFRLLVEGDADSPLLHATSPLNDHRRFFSYDVKIFHNGTSIGLLSKRFGPGSGGEHRTPLYVIFGAALAAAYGKSKTAQTPGGLIMLDEAFEKMDAQNVRATAEYLNALGLQMILAGPEADQPKMSSFLDIYYDMARHGSDQIQLTKNIVLDEAKELLRSDNYLLYPELLETEMARLVSGASDAG